MANTYNPALHSPFNKAIAVQGLPLDARTMYFTGEGADPFRPYINETEAREYLNTRQKRRGGFLMFTDEGMFYFDKNDAWTPSHDGVSDSDFQAFKLATQTAILSKVDLDTYEAFVRATDSKISGIKSTSDMTQAILGLHLNEAVEESIRVNNALLTKVDKTEYLANRSTTNEAIEQVDAQLSALISAQTIKISELERLATLTAYKSELADVNSSLHLEIEALSAELKAMIALDRNRLRALEVIQASNASKDSVTLVDTESKARDEQIKAIYDAMFLADRARIKTLEDITNDLPTTEGLNALRSELLVMINANKTAIDLETAARISTDQNLQRQIDLEVAARANADTIITTEVAKKASLVQLGNETSARTLKDADLDQKIAAEIETRKERDAEIWAELAEKAYIGTLEAEALQRIRGDEFLQAQIDAYLAGGGSGGTGDYVFRSGVREKDGVVRLGAESSTVDPITALNGGLSTDTVLTLGDRRTDSYYSLIEIARAAVRNVIANPLGTASVTASQTTRTLSIAMAALNASIAVQYTKEANGDDTYKLVVTDPSGKGLEGAEYFGEKASDFSYVQKKYVDSLANNATFEYLVPELNRVSISYGMKKIVVTSDIAIDGHETKPGESGMVIIVQDDIGGHLIEPGYNSSMIEGKPFVLNTLPRAISLLHWLRDDKTIYWSSEVIQRGIEPTTTPVIRIDEIENTFEVFHSLPDETMVISENGGEWLPYTGEFTITRADRPYGYWRVRVTPDGDRLESAIAYSNATNLQNRGFSYIFDFNLS